MFRRQNKWHRYLVPGTVIFFLLLTSLFVFFTYQSLVAPITSVPTATTPFVVVKGDSTLGIAQKLYSAGLIRSPFGFRLEVKRLGLQGELQAGSYELSPTMSAREIAEAMTNGQDQQLTLQIPEGFRTEEVAVKVEQSLNIPAADFLAAAKGSEGYLFPDTYFFALNSTADQVVKRMKDTFDRKTASLPISQEAVILASLIERESKEDEEKPLVAGILQKRLAAGWPLQLDATVQYALGTPKEWWPVTSVLDRQTPSPYNTYLHSGLTPGPICNPGLASLFAALNPEPSDYWFYLHDRNGQIRFAKTSVEHNANIERYLR